MNNQRPKTDPALSAIRTAFVVLLLAVDARSQVASNVSATNFTDSSAVITWTTNVPASSQVLYGVTTSYG